MGQMDKETVEMIEHGFHTRADVNSDHDNAPAGLPAEDGSVLLESEESAGERNEFMELYEESLKGIEQGKVVRGEIVQMDDEYVLVDIGYKSEGQIRISEFTDSAGAVTANVGDPVDVLLVRKEDKDGHIVLSKEKAERFKVWDDIKDIYERDGTVKGRIVSQVKGGFSVDIGLQAFLPGSQVDVRPTRDMAMFVGKTFDFKVIKYDRLRKNIVVSRRALLEEARMALRAETLKKLEEGAVLDGTVTSITHYGLFVDLGGIDGLVHVTDMSWGRVGNPAGLYNVGDEITVKVLNIDSEKNRVSLGIKQLTPDPWVEAPVNYPAGAKVEGRVVGLKEYGAFVELEAGVEGLIHLSELSWTEKLRHPSQILNVGDTVEAMVLSVDSEKNRISLSIKQLEPNPWDTIAENYPVGTIIEGKIKNITDFGIFVGIDEGINGLIHITDISWIKPVKSLSELYKKGQEVQAIVLDVDRENERFSLGIKQLTPDPWEGVAEKYKPGTLVRGTVTSVADFGIFVALEEGVEGLIHVSELPKAKGEDPLSQFQADDMVQAQVVNVSREDKKIGLTIRNMKADGEKDAYRDYVNNQTKATSNLGELLEGAINQQRQS
jgi:small subunit ribosomal protein S1